MDLDGMSQLQDLDLQRDTAKRQLQAILNQISDFPHLPALDAEIDAQHDLQRQADAAIREASAVVQTAQRRIEVSDKRLYSGAITDHRTLEELQRELYSQRQRLPTLQDDERRARADAAQAQSASEWLAQLRRAALRLWQDNQAALDRQRFDAQEQVDEFSRLIELRRDTLSPDDLALYDQQRRRGRPQVVANVAGGVCNACRLTVPTVLITRARRGLRAVECPTCGCILRVT